MKKGDTIIANYGAMHPIEEGEIVKVDKKTKLNGAYAIDVLFHDGGAVKKLMTSDINTKSVNGSPIGYWTEEAYYVD